MLPALGADRAYTALGEARMEEGRPSSTAVAAAMMRAAHLLWDAEPKILRDELALGLSGLGDETTLRATLDAMLTELQAGFSAEFAQAVFRHFRAMAVLRSRYV